MRNLKKVLSLVLCMAMMLSVMVVGAGAAFKDQEKIVNDEAVDMCVALKIINGYTDGSYRPEGNVTRAEMCKMICIALNGGKEPATATKTVPTYSDIDGHWAEGYIEYCNTKGIVAGVGGGKFNPNGNVTGSQAAKMLLVALGYNADVEKYTGASWELYVNVQANQDGLYTDLETMDPSAALSRDNAAQMIWNALNAYVINKESSIDRTDGSIVDSYVKSTTDLLAKAYQAKTFIGTFDGNYDTGDADTKGEVAITGMLDTENSKDDAERTAELPADIDIANIGEEYAVVFKDGKGGTADEPDKNDTIYGIYNTGKTEVLNVVASDIATASKQTTDADKMTIDGTNYKVDNTKTGKVVIYNYDSEQATSTDEDTTPESIFEDLYAPTGDTIKFIFDDGKIVKAYVTNTCITKVTAVNSEKVTLKDVGAIKIADNDVYTGIAKNDIVTYTKLYDTDKDDATFIVEKADTVTGTVKGFKGTENVTVDAKTYDIYGESAMPSLTDDAVTAFGNAYIDEEVTLYLVNGYVGAADSATTTNYALITAVDPGDIGATFNPLKVEVLLADGTKAIYTVDKDDTTVTANDIAGAAVITYSYATDGKIAITDVKIAAEEMEPQVDEPVLVWDEDMKSFDGIVAAGNAVLFVYNIDNDKYYAYDMRSLDDIKTDKYASVTNTDGKVVAAYVILDSKPASAADTTFAGIVTAANGTVKVDDTYKLSYTVAMNGETATIYLPTSADLKKGDLVYFEKTSDNIYGINDVTVVADQGYVKEYAEADSLLTYGTAFDGDGKLTDIQSVLLEKDCIIVYVNQDKDVAGDEIGIPEYDAIEKYTNVSVVNTDTDSKFEIVFIETSNETNIVNTPVVAE